LSELVLRSKLQSGPVIPLDRRGLGTTPFNNNSYSILRLRSEWQNWLSNRNFALFATLTYDHQVTRHIAEQDLRHFRNRLYDKIHGEKTGEYLSFVGFLENTRSGNPHWHLLFEPIFPKLNETTWQAFDRLKYFIKRVWLRMRNTPVSEVGLNIQPVYEQSNLIDYCLKESTRQAGCDFVKAEYLMGQSETQATAAS